jgi:NSS family neurotransmitter:Na+ symporter
MYFCIFRGVKLVGKIVWLTVPIPWLMLLILAVRGLTLEGSIQGLAYYLDPDWSRLATPVTWRYAFGQVFFSLSLAFGVMITYASFLHRKSDLNNNALIISLADFATSFVAGLAVFATLGAMAFATQQAGSPGPVEEVARGGPSLAFVAFPYALAQLPYSAFFSFVFFFALVTLGIDSAFSITESVLASIVDKTGWPRAVVLPVMSIIGLSCGLVYITRGGLDWLGTIDGFVNGTWGIAFLGLLECIVLGWLWRVDILRRHANSRSDWHLGEWWDWLVRLFIPFVLGVLFFWQLFEDVSSGGFFRTAEGGWNIGNCIGMAVVAMAPVAAVIFSLTGPPGGDPPEVQTGRPAFRTAGVAMLLSISAAAIMAATGVPTAGLGVLILAAASAAAVAVAVFAYRSNCAGHLSWPVRWGGLAGPMGLSASAATILFRLTRSIETSQAPPVREGLGGVSYIILAVVLLIIVGGLGWCFYRAILASGSTEGEQRPDEVGDESPSA